MDDNLNIIDTLISSPNELKNLAFYENKLWVQAELNNEVQLLKIARKNQVDTHTFPLLANQIDFIVSGNNYIFIGNSFSDQPGLYTFKNVNTKVDEVQLPDIEIVDFDIYDTELDYYHSLDDSFAIGYYFSSEISIKNNGTDTLNEFSVYVDLKSGMNCYRHHLYRKFSGYEILPGQKETIDLQNLLMQENNLNKAEICFELAAPNSKFETLVDNNTLCKTFIILGTNNLAEPNIQVYPNPISDFLLIENAELNIKNVALVDINGREVLNQVATSQQIIIETASLKAGIYLLKINTGDNLYTQRIVKK